MPSASVAIGLLEADGVGALTSGMFDQNECGTINSSVAINAGALTQKLRLRVPAILKSLANLDLK